MLHTHIRVAHWRLHEIRATQKNKPQVEKFKEAACELEADEREYAFDALVKKIAKPDPAPKKPEYGARK